MLFKNKIIETFIIFILSIFVYIILVTLLFSGFNVKNWFIIISGLTTSIFTLKFEDPSSVGAVIFLVGVTASIINYFSKIFPPKLNFLILPIISILLVFLFAIIPYSLFPLEERGGMGAGLAMALYMGTAIIFQIIFSFIISIKIILKK